MEDFSDFLDVSAILVAQLSKLFYNKCMTNGDKIRKFLSDDKLAELFQLDGMVKFFGDFRIPSCDDCKYNCEETDDNKFGCKNSTDCTPTLMKWLEAKAKI